MVNLEDHRDEATIVHWHGQKPPADQDGVGQCGIPLLQPGERRAYDFAARPGTYWMHSHQGFPHQKMLSAPLIVRTTDDVRAAAEEVTIFMVDFLFRDTTELLAELQKGVTGHHGAIHGGMAGLMSNGGLFGVKMPPVTPGKTALQ